MDANSRGKLGEAIALEYLLEKGYALVTTGYRSRFGEIDIIVKDNRFVVFVEVKLRKNAKFAQGREFVGKSKQDKLRTTAEMWLVENLTNLQPRFDVIEIYAPRAARGPEIIHIENAF